MATTIKSLLYYFDWLNGFRHLCNTTDYDCICVYCPNLIELNKFITVHSIWEYKIAIYPKDSIRVLNTCLFQVLC